ncbi:MAG: tetratricopeptide repeat protein [SAR202 cluster bacterium]|nr:tetratricopeptide repeat protein [SAR202 cluster bacterium]
MEIEDNIPEKQIVPDSSTSIISTDDPTSSLLQPEDNEPFALYEYARAVTLLRAAEYYQAVQQFDKVLRIHPKLHKAYIGRAIALSHTNQLTAALEDIDKAIDLVPEYAATYNARGYIHANNQSSELAIADFLKAISLNPAYPEPYENLGFLYHKLGKTTNAQINIEQAISLYKQLNNYQKVESLSKILSSIKN